MITGTASQEYVASFLLAVFWYIFAAKTLLKKKHICFLQHNMHAQAGARKIPYFIPPLKTGRCDIMSLQDKFRLLFQQAEWILKFVIKSHSSMWCKTGLGDQISTITQSHKLYIARSNNAIHIWKFNLLCKLWRCSFQQWYFTLTRMYAKMDPAFQVVTSVFGPAEK